jgi:single-stranded DNA-binding protein
MLEEGRPIFVESRLRIDSWEDKQSEQAESAQISAKSRFWSSQSAARAGSQRSFEGEELRLQDRPSGVVQPELDRFCNTEIEENVHHGLWERMTMRRRTGGA